MRGCVDWLYVVGVIGLADFWAGFRSVVNADFGGGKIMVDITQRQAEGWLKGAEGAAPEGSAPAMLAAPALA